MTVGSYIPPGSTRLPRPATPSACSIRATSHANSLPPLPAYPPLLPTAPVSLTGPPAELRRNISGSIRRRTIRFPCPAGRESHRSRAERAGSRARQRACLYSAKCARGNFHRAAVLFSKAGRSLAIAHRAQLTSGSSCNRRKHGATRARPGQRPASAKSQSASSTRHAATARIRTDRRARSSPEPSSATRRDCASRRSPWVPWRPGPCPFCGRDRQPTDRGFAPGASRVCRMHRSIAQARPGQPQWPAPAGSTGPALRPRSSEGQYTPRSTRPPRRRPPPAHIRFPEKQTKQRPRSLPPSSRRHTLHAKTHKKSRRATQTARQQALRRSTSQLSDTGQHSRTEQRA